MPRRHPRKFSLEFKREAVRLVKEQDLSFAQVARDLGVDRGLIRAWVLKSEAGELAATPVAKVVEEPDEDLEAEVRRLRREVEILREEREILKKATAFFAKESR